MPAAPSCKETSDLLISVTLCSRKDGDKNPLWFTLGMREVLPGWDKGLQDMCTGERRKLTIPPALAYGKEGKGIILIKPAGRGHLQQSLNSCCVPLQWGFTYLICSPYRQNPSEQYTHF